MKRFWALLLALAMLSGPCAFAEETAAPVFAVGELSGNFNPFFAEAEGDRLVAALANGALLTTARGGDIVRSGIAGETISFDTTPYDYTSLADAEVARNADGSADYTLTLREDACFSDGAPVTVDDVIFSIYVRADADYDGPCSLAGLPIEGLAAYRGDLQRLDALLLAAGRENSDFSLWSADTQAAFWADIDAAGAQLCGEIVDYCMDTYLDDCAAVIGSTPEEIRADSALQLELAMVLWGYEEDYFDGATAADFWSAILRAYDGDAAAAERTERVSTPLKGFIDDYDAKYGAQISVGGGAANISGVTRLNDFSLRIHATEHDSDLLPALAACIAPLHVYGDPALYDYGNDSFGFTRSDLRAVRAVQDASVGCGPYVVEAFDGAGATLRANEYYYRGVLPVEQLRLAAYAGDAGLKAVLGGAAALTVTELDAAAVGAINAANGDAGLSGECADTLLVDAPEYAYLGANVELVKVGDDANSAASVALRRALMTVLSAQREEMVARELSDGAFVIEYPLLNSSWAAPGFEDEGYGLCYARNASGAPIYADDMGDEARHEAALTAAVDDLKRAGYTWDEAAQRFTAAPEGASMEYVCSVAEGEPAAALVEAAAEQLSRIGIALRLRALTQDELDAAVEAGGAQLWIAHQACGNEPELYAWYHSDNVGGSNLFRIADGELDGHIMDFLSEDALEARRAACKSALDAAMELGCVLPLYQPCLGVVTNAAQLDCDSLPEDMTPFYGWWAEPEHIILK